MHLVTLKPQARTDSPRFVTAEVSPPVPTLSLN